MTLETANEILQATLEMTGNEIALLTLIKDLQVRHVEALARIDRLEEGTGNWKERR